MKTSKIFIMGCMAAVFALDCSVSYAVEDDGTVFFSGRVGASDRITNCSGNCRADPSGTIGIGFSGDYHDEGIASFIFRNAISLDYSRYQFNINGNVLNVAEKTIQLYFDTALQAHPRYSFTFKLNPSWTTTSSLNTSDRTVFGVGAGLDLLYQVEPGFYVLVGGSVRDISPANQPDFSYRTVDFGFRWYL